MAAVDWTEKCRAEMPREAGYLDYPFQSGETWDSFIDFNHSEDDQDGDS